jgi:hypothetical protein
MPQERQRTPVARSIDAPGVVVERETFQLVQTMLDRELRSRDTLRGSLTALLAFSGAVLALSAGAEATVLQHGLGSVGQPSFFGVLALAQGLLVLTIFRAVKSLDARPRGRLKTSLLVDLGYEARASDEIRGLAYRTTASTLDDVAANNDVLGGQLRAVIDALRAALLVVAGTVVILAARGIGL